MHCVLHLYSKGELFKTSTASELGSLSCGFHLAELYNIVMESMQVKNQKMLSIFQ